jgi:hypothetical protein
MMWLATANWYEATFLPDVKFLKHPPSTLAALGVGALFAVIALFNAAVLRATATRLLASGRSHDASKSAT